MFDIKRAHLSDHVYRYAVTRNGVPFCYTDALDAWQHDESFRRFFIAVLAQSPFPAYRWETPPITSANVMRDFEFVLVDAPEIAMPPDGRAFAARFSDDDIVAFENLGGDAVLVVPSPRGPSEAYPHLGAFIRGAPDAQVHALWSAVGREAQRTVGDRPLWISTAGGGVAWLHVRLDSRPKYYVYAPYATARFDNAQD